MSGASSQVEAWLPRSLLRLRSGSAIPAATAEGLTPVRLSWADGRLQEPELLSTPADRLNALVLPRLVDPHVHLDKAFTWSTHPNLGGTYDGALEANMREHGIRDLQAVLARGDQAISRACDHGLRAMRSHIDSLGPGADASWEALQALKTQWHGQVELQLVALVPIAHWSTTEGKQLGQRVAASGGLLGGVLVPPCRGTSVRRDLRALLTLAEELGCGIDLHIDEANHGPAQGLQQLLRALEQVPCSQPITCSHASSLALLSPQRLRRLAERMAEHRLQVVALPLTNGWLLGQSPEATPLRRPLAPIRQLQRAGVRVALGGDNVADPWFPAGDFDPLALMASCIPLAQLAPWQRLGLSPFTTAASAVMGLGWDGRIGCDAPADLIVLEADSWSEALRRPPERRVLIRGRWWKPGRR